jgi:hypothetical protein
MIQHSLLAVRVTAPPVFLMAIGSGESVYPCPFALTELS